MNITRKQINTILTKLALINALIYLLGVVVFFIIFFKSGENDMGGIFLVYGVIYLLPGSISLMVFKFYKNAKHDHKKSWRIVYIISYIYLFITWYELTFHYFSIIKPLLQILK